MVGLVISHSPYETQMQGITVLCMHHAYNIFDTWRTTLHATTMNS